MGCKSSSPRVDVPHRTTKHKSHESTRRTSSGRRSEGRGGTSSSGTPGRRSQPRRPLDDDPIDIADISLSAQEQEDRNLALAMQMYYLNRSSAASSRVPSRPASPDGERQPTILAEELELFPTYEPEPDEECTICMEDARQMPGKWRRLPCMHAYHATCIDAWLGNNTTCPTCNCDVRCFEDQDVIDRSISEQ